MEILEVIRLVRAGESDHTITALLGHNRRTVAKYRQWAAEQGLLAGDLPSAGTVQQSHLYVPAEGEPRVPHTGSKAELLELSANGRPGSEPPRRKAPAPPISEFGSNP